MTNQERSFGEVLHLLREKKDVTLRELARKINVSAPFLSDVEKGRRAPLTLNLDKEEERELYDAAGRQRKTIAPDLPDYIMEREYVSAALRTARDLDAGEEEWRKFVEDLKQRRG